MKKYLFTIGLSILTLSVLGQAKKPTLMVFPSDVWCTQSGYMEAYDNQGTATLIPDYKIALQTSKDLKNVISMINTLMSERGFPLKDLEQSTKSITQLSAEDNLLTSKTSGAGLAENPIDKLRRTAKADIILEVDWTVNASGPKKTITYNLRGLDAYTNKQVAGAQGTGQPSFSAETAVLLQEAVVANMDNFTAQLQKHFDDMFENGREVTIDIRVFDNGTGLDLETEFDGLELTEIIDDWMAKNTVNHRYNKSDATETFILFEQVRIPLYRSNGTAMDTETFARELSRFLRAAPYNIPVKVLPRGLGRCALILGEK